MLEDHLRCTTYKLIHRLHRNQDVLNHGPSETATYTLLKTAKLLQKYSTSVIFPMVT